MVYHNGKEYFDDSGMYLDLDAPVHDIALNGYSEVGIEVGSKPSWRKTRAQVGLSILDDGLYPYDQPYPNDWTPSVKLEFMTFMGSGNSTFEYAFSMFNDGRSEPDDFGKNGGCFVRFWPEGEDAESIYVGYKSELAVRLAKMTNPIAAQLLSNYPRIKYDRGSIPASVYVALDVEKLPLRFSYPLTIDEDGVKKLFIESIEVNALATQVEVIENLLKEEGLSNLQQHFIPDVKSFTPPVVTVGEISELLEALFAMGPEFRKIIEAGLSRISLMRDQHDFPNGVRHSGRYYADPLLCEIDVANAAHGIKNMDEVIASVLKSVYRGMNSQAYIAYYGACKGTLNACVKAFIDDPHISEDDFKAVANTHSGISEEQMMKSFGYKFNSEKKSWEFVSDGLNHTKLEAQNILHGLRPDIFAKPMDPGLKRAR